MAANEEKRMIVGLDIGTSKVVAVVGEIDTDGTIDIVTPSGRRFRDE